MSPMFHPVTGSGAAQSLRPISPRLSRATRPWLRTDPSHRGCAQARTLLGEARPLHDTGVPVAHMPAAAAFDKARPQSLCQSTPAMGRRKNKRPGSLTGSGPRKIRVAEGAGLGSSLARMGWLLMAQRMALSRRTTHGHAAAEERQQRLAVVLGAGLHDGLGKGF